MLGNKIFFNLENNKKEKSCIKNIFVDENSQSTIPTEILTEFENFYSKLYKENSLTLGDSMNNFLNGADNGKQCLSKKLNRVKSFMQNKTPGNDGPTSEFTFLFRIFGKSFH